VFYFVWQDKSIEKLIRIADKETDKCISPLTSRNKTLCLSVAERTETETRNHQNNGQHISS